MIQAEATCAVAWRSLQFGGLSLLLCSLAQDRCPRVALHILGHLSNTM